MFLHYGRVKNKQPKTKYEDYLNHESEPRQPTTYNIDPELEDELMANRFFLKRRVWKNMDKIRRANARLNTSYQSHNKKVLKPRQLHMPV